MFSSFGLIAPKTLSYLAFQSFDFKLFWWRLFRDTLCAQNLISTFSLQHILIRYQGLYYCHCVASLHGINSQVVSAASAATCFIIAFLLHNKLEYLRLYLNKYIRHIVAVCFIGGEALNIYRDHPHLLSFLHTLYIKVISSTPYHERQRQII